MSLLKRILGWPSDDAVAVHQPERSSSEAFRKTAVSRAESEGIAVIDNGTINHEPVDLVRRRVSGAKRFREPQSRSHRITFGGSDAQRAVAFIEELAKILERGEPRKMEAHWVLHEDLNELAKSHYPGKIFQLSNDRHHELCDEKTLKFQPKEHHKRAAYHALANRMTLEFCYRKPTKDGGKTFNIKRVQVTAVNDDWFRGVDSRGPRNYRFDRMFGCALDKGNFGTPEPVPHLEILLLHGHFGQGVFMTFGLRGANDNLIKPTELADTRGAKVAESRAF